MTQVATHMPQRERVVYETRRQTPRPRGERVRLKGIDGRWHVLLTVGIRTDRNGAMMGTVDGLICRQCGYAYGHKRPDQQPCDECRVEEVAAIASCLEAAGVQLGWGTRNISKADQLTLLLRKSRKSMWSR